MPVADPLFPVHLVIAGKRCLVVGGGRIAARKARELLSAGATVVVIAPEIGDELDLLPIVRVRRRYQPGDVDGYWLAIAATNDAEVNRAVHRDGEASHVWVNSVDDPQNCSFITPAIARRGPITVSISTGGRSPALAGWLRRRIEAELGPEYLVLLEALEKKRNGMREQNISTESVDWDRFINESLAS